MRVLVWILIVGLSAACLAVGVTLGAQYSLGLLCLWLGVEMVLYRLGWAGAPLYQLTGPRRSSRLVPIADLLRLFSRSDQAAETLLFNKISEIRVEADLSDAEVRWLERLKELSELRAMIFGKALPGRKGLRQAFAFSVNPFPAGSPVSLDDFSVQDVTESAIVMADRYWKLFEAATGDTFPELAPLARQLCFDVFGEAFDAKRSRATFERLTDTMQREGGLPFLILNLIRRQDLDSARRITVYLLTMEEEVDEEVRSSLYWLTELHWFSSSEGIPVTDFESSLRYLYHLCFTNPDRAGFLEIDSQFFSQFESVNELAREGFLFKETLLEKILSLWQQYEGYFDDAFRSVLEVMAQRRSKIYDERETWVRFWKREKEAFSRDYLYVVEGNLFYAGGHYEDACAYYEKALTVNPTLRPAMLNVLFAYAKLKRWEHHSAMVERVVREPSLQPAALSVIANSYLLLGEEAKADRFYDSLRQVKGWERKTEYYKSTFCFENGLFAQALRFAKLAHQENPADASTSYHLSLCYNAVGEKASALETLEKMGESPEHQWLSFYRFTLERDAGRDDSATKTLLGIPSEYFEDPEELEAAVNFARSRQDLTLLRHLRTRAK